MIISFYQILTRNKKVCDGLERQAKQNLFLIIQKCMQNDTLMEAEQVMPTLKQKKSYFGFFLFCTLLFLALLWVFFSPLPPTKVPSSSLTPEQLKAQDLGTLAESETANALLISRLKLTDLPQAELELSAAQQKINNLQSSLEEARSIRAKIQEAKTRIINSSYLISAQSLSEQSTSPVQNTLSTQEAQSSN